MSRISMRILYVVHQFYPKYVTGTEQYVLMLAREGRRRGDDVRVFAVDPDFRETEPPEEVQSYRHEDVPVTLYRFDKGAIKNHVLTDYHNPPVGRIFRQVLDEFRPQAVHFFHLRWVGIDRMDDVEARGIPFAVHLMDFWYVCPNFLLLRPGGEICDGPPDGGLGCFDCVHQGIAPWAREPWAREVNAQKLAAGEDPVHDDSGQAAGYAMMRRPALLAAALARAARVFAPSRAVREVLAAAGARSERTELQPYCIDWQLLRGLPAAPDGAVHFGFLGTIAPHKGLDVLLQAFAGLGDDVRLKIHSRFGDYPEYDAEVQRLAEGDARVEFRGPFDRSELGQVLGGLHVLVVPSRWRENTPFVCLEGRAAGLVLVASDLPGMIEAVPEGRGRTFRVGDPGHLAEALREVAAEVRARGHARLDPDRSIPTVADRYTELRATYRELAGCRSLWDRIRHPFGGSASGSP